MTRNSLSATTAAVSVPLTRGGSETMPAGASSPRATLSLSGRAGRVSQALSLGVGDTLARRYHIAAVIGTGGSGVVYQAHDRVLGEAVAIQAPAARRRRAGRNGGLGASRGTARGTSVTHRNVVRMHDVGDSEHGAFLTMELVEGTHRLMQ